MTSYSRTIKSYHMRMTSIYGKLFLGIISFFTLVFIAYLFYSNSMLLDSQREIKASYAEHIRKADSLYIDIMNYNKAMTDNILSLNSGLLADSLIKSMLAGNNNLSQEQYNTLASLILNHRKVMGDCQEQYESKIQRDSLRLSIERDLLVGQTKTMVDLHLNKIEHEYSNITIWAAILTILFLVFSFYSVFKMDELIQQGNEGVKDIRQLKRDGEQEVDKLRNQKDTTKKEIDLFILDQQARVKAMFEAIKKMMDDIERSHKDSLESFNEQRQMLDEKIKQIENQIKQLLENKEQQFKTINDQMTNLITQTSAYINTSNLAKDDAEQSGKEEQK